MTAVATAQRKARLTVPGDVLGCLDDPGWWQPWFQRGDWSVLLYVSQVAAKGRRQLLTLGFKEAPLPRPAVQRA
jgi:hypothetical protein